MANNNYSGKRWLYLAVGTVLLIFCGLIYGWSLFKAPFGEIYTEWSLSQLSMTFTISMIFFCLGGFVAGKMSAKIKPNKIIMMSAVLLLVGFVGVSRMDPANSSMSLPMLYVFYGVFAGTGVGFSYNGVISSMNKWFPDKQGLAPGIMMMGFGLGALILGSIATSLIAAKGILTTFMILGIMIFVVLMIGSFFIKNPEVTETAASEKTEAPAVPSMTTGEMLKSFSFWIFFIWCVVANAAGLMVIGNAASIAVLFGAPAIVGMVVSVCNGAGRVIIGAIFDKIGRKMTMLINVIILLAAGIVLVLGAKTAAVAIVIIGLVCTGLTYGGNPTITSAFISKQYGPENFPVNFSIANFSLIPAAIVGPMVASSLITAANGSYITTFMAMVGCGVVALILWVVLNAACKKEA
ncbi:MAG: OFA family MFS transporter [Clostridiales bacterium]|nr:OFA family MFS transporter [Clostridiales bacterium]